MREFSFHQLQASPTPDVHPLCTYSSVKPPSPVWHLPACRLDSGNFSDRHVEQSVNDLRVVSWNIRRGEAFEQVLARLRQLDADVLLLSEVDRMLDRSGNRAVARDLAQALAMNYVFAVEFIELDGIFSRNPMGEHGQAILSKYPLGNAQVIRHPVFAPWFLSPTEPRWGNRITLVADTQIGTRYTRLLNTHLESLSTEKQRAYSVEQILQVAGEVGGAFPQIFGGDFNTVGGSSEQASRIISRAGFTNPFPGRDADNCTSSRSCYRLDWLLYRGREIMPRAWKIGDYDGSDHRWLSVDFTATQAISQTW
ncbi:MAG: endonuclease/exonuclease/phosphatase family protein [Myxococcota bacterium]